MSKQFTPPQEPATVGSQGQVPDRRQGPGSRLKHAPCRDFVYKAHPARWGKVGDKLLPLLSMIRFEPGLNGVDRYGSPDLAIVAAKRKGWIIIPHEVVPNGGYSRQHAVEKGSLHCSIWEQPIQVGGRPKWRRDPEGYIAFLEFLVAEGIVPLPEPEILEDLEEMTVERLRTLADRKNPSPRRENDARTALELIRKAHQEAKDRAANEHVAYDGPQFATPASPVAETDDKPKGKR